MEVVETEVETAEGALAAVLVLGWLVAAVETRLRAAVMVGCKASFRLDVASRDGVVAVADEGTLPVQTEHNIAF